MDRQAASLDTLPDDLILDIVEHLDTARDIASATSLTRRAHSLLAEQSWRSFVRRHFPNHRVPVRSASRWSNVANRLTYLDRCWEKRGLYLTFYRERASKKRGPGQRRGRGQQSVLFHPVVDAALLSSSSGPEDELVAWGAGEDLIIRRRTGRGEVVSDGMRRVHGHTSGYCPGTGDITALSALERDGSPEVVVGRANGDLELLSADGEGFGLATKTLLPLAEDIHQRPLASRKSPGQTAVSWVEWQPQSQLLASCCSSVVAFHDLAEDNTELSPMAYLDTSVFAPDDETCLVRSVKFLDKHTMACALGGTREPLIWGQITPTGLDLFPVPQNETLLNDVSSKTEIAMDEKTSVRAIEPVGPKNNSTMILGAWDDGTYRLVDLRTPSPHDAIYRDQFQPYQAGSSLLVYGTDRFVAGSSSQPDLRFFDFRYPKRYHHTTVSACSGDAPFPRQQYGPGSGGDSDAEPMTRSLGDLGLGSTTTCDPFCKDSRCVWHRESLADPWRSDATLHLGDTSYDCISSLSKASDASDTFYCGIRGGVVEATLAKAEDWVVDRHRVKRTAPPGWQISSEHGEVRLMETGIGLCTSDLWRGANALGMPRMLYHHNPFAFSENETGGVASPRSRLDSAWRTRLGELPA